MKNYLLLRDNHQYGPYTAESLQQMTLKKFDLIWIVGESLVWKYPSEIKELRRFAPKAEMTEATRVNNLKEEQMIYFQSCIGEGLYKNSASSLPGLPAGFEYLEGIEHAIDNNADRYQQNAEETMAEETVSKPAHMFDYLVLGTTQIIDTPELAADESQFTTTIKMSSRHKRNPVRKPNQGTRRKHIAPGITGLLTLIVVALTNIRL